MKRFWKALSVILQKVWHALLEEVKEEGLIISTSRMKIEIHGSKTKSAPDEAVEE